MNGRPEADPLYVVVREQTADVCDRTEMRVTAPMRLADARRRAEEENAAAMPGVQHVVHAWDEWRE